MRMLLLAACLAGVVCLEARPALAQGASCQASAGAQRANELVRQCRAISEASSPPCHVANPCDLIIDEITRWCRLRQQNRIAAPDFCASWVGGPGASAAGRAQQRLDVPIILEGRRGDLSDCAGGEVHNLDPRGDNFLSVRSGPGGQSQGYREIDRIVGNGQEVSMCGTRGAWVAIIYRKGVPSLNAGCNMPPSRAPYTGPCAHGWVHRNYVRITAG